MPKVARNVHGSGMDDLLGDSTYDSTPTECSMQVYCLTAEPWNQRHKGSQKVRACKKQHFFISSVEVVLKPWAAWGYAQTIAAVLQLCFLQSMVQICYQNVCFYE